MKSSNLMKLGHLGFDVCENDKEDTDFRDLMVGSFFCFFLFLFCLSSSCWGVK